MSAALDANARLQALCNEGTRLLGEGHLEPSRLHFLAALGTAPDHPQVLQNLGAVLRLLRHYAVGEAVARRSVLASGGDPHMRSNLGVALLHNCRYEESLAEFRAVLDQMPNSAPSWHNYGLALYTVGKHKEALAAFDKTLALAPDNQTAQSDRALTLLSLGRLQEGLEAYEVRWALLAKSSIWSFGAPEWQGESLAGRRVLVHHEQGLGDTIMLSRFLPALAAQGASLTVAVPAELVRLLARSFPFMEVVAIDDEKLPERVFDFHTPMLSVMRWLGVEKPGDIGAKPYLVAKPPSGLRLPHAALRIGICWTSGDHGPLLAERRRVVPLHLFFPLLAKPDVAVVSLQKGKAADDIVANGAEGLVYDLTPKFTDFAVTADVISTLDLVISVDSAVAHLAGALGKPCIMLSPFSRCWRWWGDGNGWPWYEEMVMLPQSGDRSWDLAVRRAVKLALKGAG